MFWLLLAGVALLCIMFTAFEKWTWTTLSLMVSGGIYFWVNKSAVIDWVVAHWESALCFAAAYLIVGVLWSFGKWFFFLIGFRDARRERQSWYLAKRGQNPDGQVPENLLPEFNDFLKKGYITTNGMTDQYYGGYSSRNYYGCVWNAVPRAIEHKSRITGWVGFWPFSMVGTVINDPLRKLIDFIFTWFKGLYQRMANYVFRNEAGLN